MKRKIFLDMDGVLADFDKMAHQLSLRGRRVKDTPRAFQQLQTIPGARTGVTTLIGMGYDLFIATKAPTGRPAAYADKVRWILEHFPELQRKIIITPDKGLLGTKDDYAVDDRPWAAHLDRFKGVVFRFGDQILEEGFIGHAHVADWDKVIEAFKHERELYSVTVV